MSKSTSLPSKGESIDWLLSIQTAHTGKRKKTSKIDMLIQESVFLGCVLGLVAGSLLGFVTGALTMNTQGTLAGTVLGSLLGILSGSLIGAVTARTAGRSGGPAVGAYTGMGLGAFLGAIAGLLIPNSVRMSALVLETPVLNVIASSRFETVAFFFFLLCILGTIIGVIVGGRNLIPRKLS